MLLANAQVLVQIELNLVVLKVVPTLLYRSSGQTLCYFLKISSILLEAGNKSFLFVVRPLIR